MTERARAIELDAEDLLQPFRDRFHRPDVDVVYLGGNSLGMLPLSTSERLHTFIDAEWGDELVSGWKHWWSLPTEAGDRIGDLVGAAPGQVVVTDSISVNVYKLAVAALQAQAGRKVLLTDIGNFPSDRYVLQGAAEQRKGQLRLVPTDAVEGVTTANVHTYLADDVALVSFSHVDYRSATIARVAELTEQAHRAGALVLWNLAHSAGVVPIDLDALGVDFAVGCTYKYLNAGPGSPGFLYVRHDLQRRLNNPIQGWWSATDPFDMDAPYRPADGITRWLTGSQPVFGVIAALEGADLAAQAGIDRLRAKSIALTDYMLELADAWLRPLGFVVASTRDRERRAGHIALAHDDAHRIGQAASAAGVVGDVRPPNVLRLAPAPLSTSFLDVWEGMSRLRDVVASQAHLALPVVHPQTT
jgi:kynureninase